MKERNPSRVNSQQLTVLFSMVSRFNGFPMFQWFPTKALEFFTLRSSLFTSFTLHLTQSIGSESSSGISSSITRLSMMKFWRSMVFFPI